MDLNEIMEFIKQWGPYLALPIIVAFVTQGLKTKIPFFSTILGLRLVHFVPVVLGILGGLLLPEDTWGTKILMGGGLGSLSLFLYKILTVSLAKKAKIEDKLLRKSLDLADVKASQFLAGSVVKDE